MTKEEAQEAAQKGKKITHRFFSIEEYVTMKDDKFLDENNYVLDWDDFWAIRNSKRWETDWEIYKL